jgi:hypothetical protein
MARTGSLPVPKASVAGTWQVLRSHGTAPELGD